MRERLIGNCNQKLALPQRNIQDIPSIEELSKAGLNKNLLLFRFHHTPDKLRGARQLLFLKHAGQICTFTG